MRHVSVEVALDPKDDPPAPICVNDPVLDIPETREERIIRELTEENARLRKRLSKSEKAASDASWELSARREEAYQDYGRSADGWLPG